MVLAGVLEVSLTKSLTWHVEVDDTAVTGCEEGPCSGPSALLMWYPSIPSVLSRESWGSSNERVDCIFMMVYSGSQ